MKKSRSIVIITAVVLVSSFIFCLAFTEIPQTNRLSGETSATETAEDNVSFTFLTTEETTETEEESTTTTKPTTTKKPATVKNPATTSNPTATTKPAITKKPTSTAYTTKYNIQEMEERLLNEEWYFYDDDGEYECRFFENGTYEIYNEKGGVCKSGYFCLDGNNLFLFNQCGDIISKMIYDTEQKEFFTENYKKETTTATTTSTAATTVTNKNNLNDSNVLWLLCNAVACYDDYINTTTLGLEYDYFGEYITCPHCGDQAFLVTNYDSYSDVTAPISKYLTGDAKNDADDYVQEIIDCDMLTERGGKLYVCSMYNERGYCRLDCSSIRLVSEYSDGSYLIAVDDIDDEEIYYLNVYFINGEYKIG